MHVEAYRRVLRLPGVRPLMVVGTLARVPITAAAITLTLHVVLDMHRGYAAAGLVGAAVTVGSAVGAPVLGRFVDRSGLRPMLAFTTLCSGLFWAVAPALPFEMLLGVAFLSGLVALPVFGVVRQSLAAMVPEDDRRQAFSLDSMTVEMSFMIGPAAAVMLVTGTSATLTMWLVGATTVIAGASLYALNPPTTEPDADAGEPRPARRTWLRPGFVAVLLIATSATLVLGGTDVGVVAVLRHEGQVNSTGIVMAAWAAYSMVGGFVYGGMRRALSPPLLAALLAACTIPVGFAGSWWAMALLLIPAGFLCAPTIAATADAVSRLVPASARGEAMGWYGSALTVGVAVGAPAAGAVIDRMGPAWGFVAAGIISLVGAALALAVRRLFRRARIEAAGPDRVPPAPRQPQDVPVAATSVQDVPVAATSVQDVPVAATSARDAGPPGRRDARPEVEPVRAGTG